MGMQSKSQQRSESVEIIESFSTTKNKHPGNQIENKHPDDRAKKRGRSFEPTYLHSYSRSRSYSPHRSSRHMRGRRKNDFPRSISNSGNSRTPSSNSSPRRRRR